MATLAQSTPRIWGARLTHADIHLPIVAADIIYEGSALSEAAAADGYANPLVAAEVFLGFAMATVDNSAGLAGAKTVLTRLTGMIKIAVAGADAITDRGATVYAADDDVFTLTSTSNTAIGKIVRWETGDTCWVKVEAAAVQSL